MTILPPVEQVFRFYMDFEKNVLSPHDEIATFALPRRVDENPYIPTALNFPPLFVVTYLSASWQVPHNCTTLRQHFRMSAPRLLKFIDSRGL